MESAHGQTALPTAARPRRLRHQLGLGTHPLVCFIMMDDDGTQSLNDIRNRTLMMIIIMLMKSNGILEITGTLLASTLLAAPRMAPSRFAFILDLFLVFVPLVTFCSHKLAFIHI